MASMLGACTNNKFVERIWWSAGAYTLYKNEYSNYFDFDSHGYTRCVARFTRFSNFNYSILCILPYSVKLLVRRMIRWTVVLFLLHKDPLSRAKLSDTNRDEFSHDLGYIALAVWVEIFSFVTFYACCVYWVVSVRFTWRSNQVVRLLTHCVLVCTSCQVATDWLFQAKYLNCHRTKLAQTWTNLE